MKEASGLNFTIDPQVVPNGMNNNFTKSVAFHMSQIDFKLTRFHLTDAEKDSYSPPEDVVNTRKAMGD